MKKKILAIATAVVLFFAVNIPASAVTLTEAPDIPDYYYNRPETIELKSNYDYGKRYATAYENGSSVATGTDSLTASYYTSADFLYYPIYYNDEWYSRNSHLPFLSLDDKEKYKITVSFKVSLNGEYTDSVYAHLFKLNADLDENNIRTTVDKRTFTSVVIVNSSDIYSRSFIEPLNGVQPVVCFGITVIGDLYGVLTIENLNFKCEIYDSSDALLEEDYGFQADEDVEKEFAGVVTQFSGFLGDLQDDMLNYAADLPGETEEFLNKLEPFRLFVIDIYDVIPDWLMWLLSFCLSVFIMRRVIK